MTLSLQNPPAAPLNVLVLEAAGYCREGLESILRPHADLELVGVAPDASFAVRLAMMRKPDVVLVRLEDETFATGTLRDLKRRIPDARVVLVVERPDAARVRLLRQAGADSVVASSARPADIVGALRTMGPAAA